MPSRFKCRFLPFVALLAMLGASESANAVYLLTTLGTLGGDSFAYGLNDLGQVVGDSRAETWDHAFLYSNGVMTDLGTLGGELSRAVAINNSGQIVGSASDINHRQHAFIYRSGAMLDLGTLGGLSSGATSINEAGIVVGWSDVDALVSRAFYYDGTVHPFDALGVTQTGAACINNSGTIVGTSTLPGGFNRAFAYAGGVVTDLGTLGGPDSVAAAINDAGDIVGYADAPDDFLRAYLRRNGAMIDLGVLGRNASEAYDINNLGQVVGLSDAGAYPNRRAFIWDTDHGMREIGPLIANGSGWSSLKFLSINNLGQIAGGGKTPGSLTKAILLTPVAFGASVAFPRGILVSGGAQEVQASDNQYLVARPGATLSVSEAPLQVVIKSTADNTHPTTMKICVESRSSTTNVGQTIALFNFSTSQYETIDVRTTTAADVSATIVATGDLRRFVDQGTAEIRMRISYKANGPVLSYPWQIRIDQAYWAHLN